VSALPDVGSAIRAALLTAGPQAKVMAARKVARDWRLGRLAFEFDEPMPDRPARPVQPELLPPNRMPRRGKGGSERGRIALWHALAHIEFVAIDLALDMAGRFGAEMGVTFVGDFLAVAADEAMHFSLLDRHLAARGSRYGALPAHDGLWQAAEETRHDVAARLAVVPMVLEARGLDVTPPTIARVRGYGDGRARPRTNPLMTKFATLRSAPGTFAPTPKSAARTPICCGFRLCAAFSRGPEASVQRLSAFRCRFIAQRLRCACLLNLSPANPQSTRRRGVPISLRKFCECRFVR